MKSPVIKRMWGCDCLFKSSRGGCTQAPLDVALLILLGVQAF